VLVAVCVRVWLVFLRYRRHLSRWPFICGWIRRPMAGWMDGRMADGGWGGLTRFNKDGNGIYLSPCACGHMDVLRPSFSQADRHSIQPHQHSGKSISQPVSQSSDNQQTDRWEREKQTGGWGESPVCVCVCGHRKVISACCTTAPRPWCLRASRLLWAAPLPRPHCHPHCHLRHPLPPRLHHPPPRLQSRLLQLHFRRLD